MAGKRKKMMRRIERRMSSEYFSFYMFLLFMTLSSFSAKPFCCGRD
jgi:hypothetical protein